jgi:hypothetical protein
MIHTRCKNLPKCDHQYSKRMADKDESTLDAVTIDTNPGNLFAHPP